MTLHAVDARTQARHDVNQRRHQSAEPQVISGRQFRKLLRWGYDRFHAAAKSGRFDHLISRHASSRSRTVYVRAKVEAWIAETVDSASPSAIQALQSRARR